MPTTHSIARVPSFALQGALALLLVAAPLAAQPPVAMAPPLAAGPAAFDPTRLARIDEWANELIAAKRIPGAVVMLVRDGQVAYHKAYGVRDVGTRAALHTDDIFRIASQTKAITSLAVMMLWEEGKFGLDDPISRYIPAFREQRVLSKFNAADSSFQSQPARRRITIRQLLTHSSGLEYADIGSPEFRAIYAKAGITAIGREGAVLAKNIDALAALPLANEPGEKFTYSLSVDVLGRLVEVVSGMPLDQFFRTRIFEPLKMSDTWFELPADKRSRLVALHRDSSGTLLPLHGMIGGLSAEFPARPVTYFSGGGGLSSTTADYARFLQLFLNGGTLDGARLISRKTVELMLTNQTPSLGFPFGLGFALETSANDYLSPVSVGTFSWSGAFKTYYWADPRERLVGLVFTNVWDSDVSLDTPFKALVYAALR